MTKCPECNGTGEMIIRDLHKWDYYTCDCGGSGLASDYEKYLEERKQKLREPIDYKKVWSLAKEMIEKKNKKRMK